MTWAPIVMQPFAPTMLGFRIGSHAEQVYLRR